MRTLTFTIFILATPWVLAQKINCDTITNFSNVACDKAVYKAPDGKHYKVQFMDETNAEKDFMEAGLLANCLDSTFAGTARKGAKTSFSTAKIEDFLTVSALIKALPKDAVIRAKVNSNSKRVVDENRNVRLTKDTYLFAFKKESDNDYHVIIGDNKDVKKATFFNVEISGLATTTNKQIQAVRLAFEKQFVNVCSDRYGVFSANPIKIQIEGSVFFDVDHKPGQIGPVGLQPATTWEIHPISKITFLK